MSMVIKVMGLYVIKKNFFSYKGAQLINNVLVSDVQHSYFSVCTHTRTHTHTHVSFFKFFSDLDYYRIWSRVPRAVQYVLVGYLY